MKQEENKKLDDDRGRGVLIEDLDVKLDLVLDGYSALDKKIDYHHEELVGFREETNFKFGIVFEKFGEIHNELQEVRSDPRNKLDRKEFELFQRSTNGLRNA
jgi:hypothetical protein